MPIDGQIDAARFLGKIGRREIDGDLARGELELRVLQRSTHAIARFAHFGIRKSDEVERGEPSGKMHLRGNEQSIESRESASKNDGQRHLRTLSLTRT